MRLNIFLAFLFTAFGLSAATFPQSMNTTNGQAFGTTTIGGRLIATNTAANGGTNHFAGTLNSGTNISSQGIFHGAASGLTNLWLFNQVFTNKTRLVFDGDSLSAGVGNNAPGYYWYLMNVLLTNQSGAIFGTNCAMPGHTVANNLSNYTNNVQPWKPSGGTNAIYINWSMFNDIAQGIDTVPQIFANWTNLMMIAKRDGFSTVAFLMPPGNFSNLANVYTIDPNRYLLNELVLSSKIVDYVVRLDQRFPVWVATNYIDGLHFNTNSQNEIAIEVLKTLFGPQRTYPLSLALAASQLQVENGEVIHNGGQDAVPLKIFGKTGGQSANLFELYNGYTNMVVSFGLTNIVFGNSTVSASPTPLNLSLGATLGTSTAGSSNNIKLYLFNSSGVKYGIGVSANLLAYCTDNSADQAFFIDGVNVMRIKYDGKIGIGTASPQQQLHVLSSGVAPIQFDSSSSGVYGIYSLNNVIKGYIGYTQSGDDGLAFINSAGSTVNLLVTDAGRVGIGTTAPGDMLDVVGDTAKIRIFDNRNATVGAGGELLLQHSGTTPGAPVTYASINAYATSASAGAENGDLVFKTINAGSRTEKMRILNTGVIYGNCAGVSNAVDIIAGSNITITTNANKRTFTIASSGGSSTELIAGQCIVITTNSPGVFTIAVGNPSTNYIFWYTNFATAGSAYTPYNAGVTGYISPTNGVLWQGGGQMTNSYTATATLDFANLAAIGCEDLTISCTGAATGDVVNLGVPNASVVANGTFTAWVSAADTVTVRFCTVVSGDPSSGVFRVQVNKWK